MTTYPCSITDLLHEYRRIQSAAETIAEKIEIHMSQVTFQFYVSLPDLIKAMLDAPDNLQNVFYDRENHHLYASFGHTRKGYDKILTLVARTIN